MIWRKDLKNNQLNIFDRTISQIKNKLQIKNTNNHFNFPKTIHNFLSILINPSFFYQHQYFLYKFLCLCFNKSVLKLTFCQSLLHPKENPIAQKYFRAIGFSLHKCHFGHCSFRSFYCKDSNLS